MDTPYFAAIFESVSPRATLWCTTVAATNTPRADDSAVASAQTRTATDAAPATKKVNRYHTVKSGDTLTEIAGRYGTTVSQIKSWNGLRGDTIYVGQRIKVGTTTTTTSSSSSSSVASSSSSSGSSSSSSASTSGTKTKYTVKRGDTLTGIASHYGVSTSDVQKWNHIRNPSDIMAGQSLVLYIRDSGWTKYTVVRGDSLGAIATRYHCTVSDLREWNALSTTVIQPGQVLKIKK